METNAGFPAPFRNLESFPHTFSNDVRRFPEEITSAKLMARLPNGRVNFQPTCYGDFGLPLKTAELALRHGGIMNEGTRTRADCTHQMAGRIVTANPCAVKTAERFYPQSWVQNARPARDLARSPPQSQPHDRTQGVERRNARRKLQGIGNMKLLGYVGRRRKVCGSEAPSYDARRTMYQFSQEPSMFGRSVARPLTGSITKHRREDRLAVISNKVEAPRGRVGTAQAGRRTVMVAAHPKRVSTPHTIYERRPDSRYNHATLFAGLEHGRARSPEYNVPILEMRLTECMNKDVMPDCWK